MVNLLKRKHKLCKKYDEDIWGFVLEKGKFNKLGEYLASIENKPKRLSRTSGFKSILNDRKKICLFYGGLKVYELTRFCKIAKTKGTGSFNDDVVSLLERRLAVAVYRMNFVSSIAQGIVFVKAGYFLVNKEIIKNPNYELQLGDLIEVHPGYSKQLGDAILGRVKTAFLPLAYPKYLEVDYEMLRGVLISEPKMEDVYYPFIIEPNFFYVSYHSRLR